MRVSQTRSHRGLCFGCHSRSRGSARYLAVEMRPMKQSGIDRMTEMTDESNEQQRGMMAKPWASFRLVEKLRQEEKGGRRMNE